MLQRTGAAGDREFFVIDGRDRLISIWKTGRLVRFRAAHDRRSERITLSSAGAVVCDGPTRPGAPVIADFYGKRKVAGTVIEGPWNAVLSDAAGEPVRLVRADEPGAGHDEYPVTLLGEESVAELARRSGAGSVDARRFRMLISFSGLSAHAEDRWQGQTSRDRGRSGPRRRPGTPLRRDDARPRPRRPRPPGGADDQVLPGRAGERVRPRGELRGLCRRGRGRGRAGRRPATRAAGWKPKPAVTPGRVRRVRYSSGSTLRRGRFRQPAPCPRS